MQSLRVVGELLAVLPLDGEEVLFPVSARDIYVFSRCDAHRLAASSVAHDVAGFVLCGPLPVGSGHLLARHKDGQPVVPLLHFPATLQLAVNSFVDFVPGWVVPRYHQPTVGSPGIGLSNCLQAVLPVPDFMHAALPRKIVNRLPDLPVGKLLDSLFQCRVFPADDFVKGRRLHSRFDFELMEFRRWAPFLSSHSTSTLGEQIEEDRSSNGAVNNQLFHLQQCGNPRCARASRLAN